MPVLCCPGLHDAPLSTGRRACPHPAQAWCSMQHHLPTCSSVMRTTSGSTTVVTLPSRLRYTMPHQKSTGCRPSKSSVGEERDERSCVTQLCATCWAAVGWRLECILVAFVTHARHAEPLPLQEHRSRHSVTPIAAPLMTLTSGVEDGPECPGHHGGGEDEEEQGVAGRRDLGGQAEAVGDAGDEGPHRPPGVTQDLREEGVAGQVLCRRGAHTGEDACASHVLMLRCDEAVPVAGWSHKCHALSSPSTAGALSRTATSDEPHLGFGREVGAGDGGARGQRRADDVGLARLARRSRPRRG